MRRFEDVTFSHRGLHFFPAFQCDALLLHTSSSIRKSADVGEDVEKLARTIDRAIKDEVHRRQESRKVEKPHGASLAAPSPSAMKLALLADQIFRDLQDLHSEESLKKIVE